ncbi:MAG: zf-HC2 domain-containing protein [Armatimonadota bacterium]
MSWHPTGEEIQSLIDGELAPQQRSVVEVHLQRCEHCRELATRVRGTAELLRALGRARPPAGLPARILSVIAQAPAPEALTCAESVELASAYLDAELEGPERDAFEAHVYTCESCYAALRQMGGVAAVLRATPSAATPADLHARITAAVAAERRRAAVFTWRRIAAAGGAVAAAAAVAAALLLPHERAGDRPGGAPDVVAQQPADTGLAHAKEPAVATAREGALEGAQASEFALGDAGASGALARRSRETRDGRRVAVAQAPPGAGSAARRSASTATPEPSDATAELAPAPRHRDAGPAAPALEPASVSAPRIAAAPAPRTTPAPPPAAPAPQVEPATGPFTPAPAPSPEPPTEVVTARAQRITGPEPSAAASPPPQPAAASRVAAAPEPPDGGPVLVAVVPRRSGTRTLYRASDEPANDAISRVNERVARHENAGWDDSRVGIELR